MHPGLGHLPLTLKELPPALGLLHLALHLPLTSLLDQALRIP
jgi:hypothetical protein